MRYLRVVAAVVLAAALAAGTTGCHRDPCQSTAESSAQCGGSK